MKGKKLSLIILTLLISFGSIQAGKENKSKSIAKEIAKYTLTGAKGVTACLLGLMTFSSTLSTVGFATVSAIILMRGRVSIEEMNGRPFVLRRKYGIFFGCFAMISALFTAAYGYAAHKFMQSFLDDITGEEETEDEKTST